MELGRISACGRTFPENSDVFPDVMGCHFPVLGCTEVVTMRWCSITTHQQTLEFGCFFLASNWIIAGKKPPRKIKCSVANQCKCKVVFELQMRRNLCWVLKDSTLLGVFIQSLILVFRCMSSWIMMNHVVSHTHIHAHTEWNSLLDDANVYCLEMILC